MADTKGSLLPPASDPLSGTEGLISIQNGADVRVSAAQVKNYTLTFLATSATVDTTNASNISSGTLAPTRLPGFNGDVTSISGTSVLSIPNGTLSFAKFQNISGLSVIGNASNSSGLASVLTGGANQVLVVNSAGTALAFGQVNLASAAAVTGVLGFTNGGTGLATGTSGGLAYFNSTTSMASSALLAANAIVLGGGAGTAPVTLGSLGTTTTVLHGNAGGAPTFGAITLTTDVTGTLGAGNGGTGNATYAIGDLIQASASTTLSRLASVATGNVLISGGVTTISSWGKVGLTTHVTGTLAEANGGTNQSTYALGDTIYASATNTISKLSGNITTNKQYLSQTGSGAVSAAPVWASIAGADVTGAALTSSNDTNVTITLGGTPATSLLRAASLTMGWAGQLAVGRGGTGLASYTIGDLIQASGATTLASLAAVATGNVLLSGGVGTVSSWGKVGLTTHVSGTLPEANGGTNQSTYALGDMLYSSATNTLSKLAGNITTTKKFLTQTGGGAVSAAPSWGTIAAADVPGSALTSTNDTNVTITLGGTPSTALLVASSLTMGWTGTLSVARGGTGGGSASGTLLDNISNFASTGFINRTGAGTYTFSTASQVLDTIGSTQGNILFRGAAGWQALAPGASAGQVLQTGGAGANPSWATISGTGTVTNVATGWGVTGGAITTTGTISLATTNPAFGYGLPINLALSASASGTTWTINVLGNNGSNPSATNPVLIPFMSTAANTGTVTWVSVTSALSVTIPASQLLGTVTAVPFRFWLVAINNAGTVELALINCVIGGATPTSIFPLATWNTISTTAIATSPSAGVFYSTTARTTVPFCILGYADWNAGVSVAGSWNTDASIIRLFGPGSKKPGDVIQTVQGSSSTGFTTTSTTFTSTNLTASISPTSSINFVKAHYVAIGSSSNTSLDNVYSQIFRGSTGVGSIVGLGSSANSSLFAPFGAVWLDNPASTSSQVYTIKIKTAAAAATAGLGPLTAGQTYGSIVLEEIMV